MRWAHVAIAAAIASAAGAAGWAARGVLADREIAQNEAARAVEFERLATAAAEAERRARATESLWRTKHEELSREAAAREAELRRAVAGERAAGERLRDAFRVAAAGTECRAAVDPAASSGGERPAGAGDLRADVFERVDAAAGEIAEYADRLRLALDACRGAYVALGATID